MDLTLGRKQCTGVGSIINLICAGDEVGRLGYNGAQWCIVYLLRGAAPAEEIGRVLALVHRVYPEG